MQLVVVVVVYKCVVAGPDPCEQACDASALCVRTERDPGHDCLCPDGLTQREIKVNYCSLCIY